MNGKSLLQIYHEQKSADEFARDSDTMIAPVFAAVLLFVVVFVVGAALDIAWGSAYSNGIRSSPATGRSND